jgi:hypothetical protein
MVLVVVGGSVVVVVVDVVVVLVVVAGIVVVVVVVVDIDVDVVVVVGTVGGPNVQPVRAAPSASVDSSLHRRASMRPSCPLLRMQTSHRLRPRLLCQLTDRLPF